MKIDLLDISHKDLLLEIASSNEDWIVIGSVNFEECSHYLFQSILELDNGFDFRSIRFVPIRLTSRRSSPWSTLEMVKTMFFENLDAIARKNKIEFKALELEYPAGKEDIQKILSDAKKQFHNKANLIVDLSAMPREMATYFSDFLFTTQSNLISSGFNKAYAVITPPEQVTSRNGFGPFSVGQPKCIYSQGLTKSLTSTHKVNLLVFPGYEGFEAKAACDLFAGHNTNITCAFSCFNYSYHKTLNSMIGNQALYNDRINKKITINYYFSRPDILRVANEFLERCLNFIDEYPEKEHAMLIAPFGPKTAIFLGSYIRKKYIEECRLKYPDKEVLTDVIVMPVSQYVSLYSRGASEPCVFAISYSKN